MTDILREKFEKLPETEASAELHGRIMNQVVSLRFKKSFVTILSILILNFAIAGSFLFIRLVHNDAFTFLSFMLREFEFSKGYFIQLSSTIYENIPLGLSLTLILNIVLIIYLLKINFSIKNGNGSRAFLKTKFIN